MASYWPREEGRSDCGYVGLTNLGGPEPLSVSGPKIGLLVRIRTFSENGPNFGLFWEMVQKCTEFGLFLENIPKIFLILDPGANIV